MGQGARGLVTLHNHRAVRHEPAQRLRDILIVHLHTPQQTPKWQGPMLRCAHLQRVSPQQGGEEQSVGHQSRTALRHGALRGQIGPHNRALQKMTSRHQLGGRNGRQLCGGQQLWNMRCTSGLHERAVSGRHAIICAGTGSCLPRAGGQATVRRRPMGRSVCAPEPPRPRPRGVCRTARVCLAGAGPSRRQQSESGNQCAAVALRPGPWALRWRFKCTDRDRELHPTARTHVPADSRPTRSNRPTDFSQPYPYRTGRSLAQCNPMQLMITAGGRGRGQHEVKTRGCRRGTHIHQPARWVMSIRACRR